MQGYWNLVFIIRGDGYCFWHVNLVRVICLVLTFGLKHICEVIVMGHDFVMIVKLCL